MIAGISVFSVELVEKIMIVNCSECRMWEPCAKVIVALIYITSAIHWKIKRSSVLFNFAKKVLSCFRCHLWQCENFWV